TLTKQHRNDYANALRNLVRAGRGPEELIDRLMISGLIEARSCERFKLLAEACDPAAKLPVADEELFNLYRGLWASEHGHYKTFINLAEQILPAEQVEKRWNEMLDAEAAIIRQQPVGPK